MEARAAARRVRNSRLLLGGAAVVTLTFLGMLQADVRYWLRAPHPTDLAGPLEFNLQPEASQQFVRVTAVPGGQTANVSHMGHQYRLFGLMSTNIVVEQELTRVGLDEQPVRGEVTRVEGRLVRDDDAFELRNVFSLLEQSGVVARIDGHLYVLRQNERPREGGTLPLELGGIALFAGINVLGALRMRRYP